VFFLDVGILVSLKNKGVLLSGIEKGNEFFFSQVVISWVGLGGSGKRGVSPFSPFIFLSHNMGT
jgi:hypothetical protein